MRPEDEFLARWQGWVLERGLWTEACWTCLAVRVESHTLNLFSTVVLGDGSEPFEEGVVLNTAGAIVFREKLQMSAVKALGQTFQEGLISSRILESQIVLNVSNQIKAVSVPRLLTPRTMSLRDVRSFADWPRFALELTSGSLQQYLGPRQYDFALSLEKITASGFGDLAEIARDLDMVDGRASVDSLLSLPAKLTLLAPIRAKIGEPHWSRSAAAVVCPYVNELLAPARARTTFIFKNSRTQAQRREFPLERTGILKLSEILPTETASMQWFLDEDPIQTSFVSASQGGLELATGQYARSMLASSVPPPETCKEVGRGGFGTVFRYRDPATGCTFALKVLSPHPFNESSSARQRFFREAMVLLRLDHPNIVRVYDYGELSDERPYIMMAYVRGQNLNDLGGVEVREGILIIRSIAKALRYAHRKKVAHRDLKESNVLFNRRRRRVVVLDFGLASAIDPQNTAQRLTRTNPFGGASCAPELRDNPMANGFAADVYSLGSIAFRLIVGTTPGGIGFEKVLQEEGRARGWSPDHLGLITGMLERDPATRPSAKEVIAALDDG